MLTVTKTTALYGIEGLSVNVEVDVQRGLPSFHVIGLGDTAVKEAGERVRSAILNSGFEYPRGRVTINLSPAGIPKRGSHYDLAMAIGILSSMGILPKEKIKDKIFIGELALSGQIIGIRGLLPMLNGILGTVKEVYMAEANYEEGLCTVRDSGVSVIGARDLKQVVDFINGEKIANVYKESKDDFYQPTQIETLDYEQVKGHWAAKEAIVASVAGGHSLLMIGPPGAGKTMLAKRVATILPSMSSAEQRETSMVYSLVGDLDAKNPMITQRPFRKINKLVTPSNLLGGGHEPLPGEISLAHNGILFIDEFLEFQREQIELLRKPLEDKKITIVRRGKSYTFPANFTLIGATNPCKCGYLGDEVRPCSCSQREVEQYQRRLSGPICERLDMCIEVQRVAHKALVGEASKNSAQMREMVQRARKIQEIRFQGLPIRLNSQMNEEEIQRFCELNKNCSDFLSKAYKKYHMSPRRYFKVMKLARTISDIHGEDVIQVYHLSAALGYTRFFDESE